MFSFFQNFRCFFHDCYIFPFFDLFFFICIFFHHFLNFFQFGEEEVTTAPNLKPVWGLGEEKGRRGNYLWSWCVPKRQV